MKMILVALALLPSMATAEEQTQQEIEAPYIIQLGRVEQAYGQLELKFIETQKALAACQAKPRETPNAK